MFKWDFNIFIDEGFIFLDIERSIVFFYVFVRD